MQQLGMLDLLLDQVGLKTFDDVGSIRGLIGVMCKDPKMLDQGMILLGKAIDAYGATGRGPRPDSPARSP